VRESIWTFLFARAKKSHAIGRQGSFQHLNKLITCDAGKNDHRETVMRVPIIALFVIAAACWAECKLATRNHRILIHGARSAAVAALEVVAPCPAITRVGSSA
jgi:hypothetical protein